MDRRSFLQALAVASIASAIPIGTVLSSPSIQFSRWYLLEEDAWVLQGRITDGNVMHIADIKHSKKDDLDMLETMIREALIERIS